MTQPATPTSTSNLALIYQEALTSIVRLRSGRQAVSDAQYFRNQFREALKLAHEEARNRNYSDEANRDARFAVVAFLDESALNLRSAVFADWARKPLQEELFGVHVGGEIFFRNLERLMGQVDSPVLGDVLEVYLLCLALGYAGRYSVSGKGELKTIRDTVLQRLRRIRGASQDLAPAWRPESEGPSKATGDPWVKRLMYAAVASVVLVLALFVVYKITLGSAVSGISSISAAAGANQ
jgi:type VI secretion system protein ImpK